ncbi:3-hydroxyisobutyrate dehydrogenase [Actinokineospora diospyrosa]|uniref:3-hydroxyisobutyrate dehydrogenase n=2 Tax=Actinokineospora diospyrosa TaxID=103728 RepID=A0ABT1IDD4_9PSEU|nr:3-hydroxyisobutyrate dehydrogenase [Actinokineospora diospyrosa]
MGTAIAQSWLAAGIETTVWNRTTKTLAGAVVTDSAAAAVAANRLVVVCLLDDDSVTSTLDGVDLAGKDLVNLTTGTPEQGRARAEWAAERGARFVDGGIMAVPPMIGTPGAFVFYSGSQAIVDEHADVLGVPARCHYVGEDPGHAALYDVALLSGMYGMFAGITHAFALVRAEGIDPVGFAPLLVDWVTATTGVAHDMAKRLNTGDFATDVTSNLAMQVAGTATFLDTAKAQGVDARLLTPLFDLMARRVAAGFGAEDNASLVDELR